MGLALALLLLSSLLPLTLGMGLQVPELTVGDLEELRFCDLAGEHGVRERGEGEGFRSVSGEWPLSLDTSPFRLWVYKMDPTFCSCFLTDTSRINLQSHDGHMTRTHNVNI